MASSDLMALTRNDALVSSFRGFDIDTPPKVSIRDAVSTALQLSRLRVTQPSPSQSSAKQNNIPEAVEHPKNVREFLYSEIPTRVKYGHPLKVKKSSFRRAGRGLFVQSNTAEGEVIFSIKQPLLSIYVC